MAESKQFVWWPLSRRLLRVVAANGTRGGLIKLAFPAHRHDAAFNFSCLMAWVNGSWIRNHSHVR
jgi:hypothetical protein